MARKYALLKHRPGLSMLIGTLASVAVGLGIAAAITHARTKQAIHASTHTVAAGTPTDTRQRVAKVNGSSANQALQEAAPSAAPQTAPKTTPKPTSTPAETANLPSPPPTSTSSAPPSSSPSPTLDLTLGTLTFNYTGVPTITFTLPVTASGDGSVTVTIIQQDTGVTLCTQTLTLAANEPKDILCGYTTSEPPLSAYATVTAGTTSAKSNSVYVGSLSW